MNERGRWLSFRERRERRWMGMYAKDLFEEARAALDTLRSRSSLPYSADDVRRLFVLAERKARIQDHRFGTMFSRQPENLNALESLRINPQTLRSV